MGAQPAIRIPKCIQCDIAMIGDRNRWTCPDCGWWMPAQGVCPTCCSSLSEPDADGCRRCLGCGIEVWPPREEYMAPSLTRQAREAWYDEQRYKRQVSSPGGGSKSGRRKVPVKKSERPWDEGA